MRCAAVIWLCAAWFASCTQGARVRDYLSLPPPENVRADAVGDSITVRWQQPARAGTRLIAGYDVYVSPRSLMYAALHELPVPAARLDTATTRVRLPVPAGAGSLFVHVRSRSPGGDLSLPSLPEIILPPRRRP